MKVLIGTPIHQVKDYCMERWLQNVAELTKVYPSDVLMIDNSPGLDYVEKVKLYCKKIGIKNYQIEHLEIVQGEEVNELPRSKLTRYQKAKEVLVPHGNPASEMLGIRDNKNVDEQIHERVARCQEFIRQFFLSKDYAAWFSWECDQIIPNNALEKLIEVMKMGNFMIVNHNCWDKNVPDGLCFDLGVSLVSRECLKKYGFLLEFGADPEPDSWFNAHAWYRKRLKRDGSPFIDLTGVISPILHL